MSNWNTRYVRYASMQERTPEAQMAHDREAWPGGCMGGFQLWVIANLRAFRKAHPEAFMSHGGPLVDQTGWDDFLSTTTIMPERT